METQPKVYCQVFMANPYAIWSTAAVAAKLLLIRHCGQIVKSDSKLSDFLKSFEMLENTVFTPLNQVFFEDYETKWMKETMQQTEQHGEADDQDNESREDMTELKTKHTMEYIKWDQLKKRIEQSGAEPIDPFHHFARCLIVINIFMSKAWMTTPLGPKTVKKIELWIGYMNEIIGGRRHHVIEHFNTPLRNEFLEGIENLTRLTSEGTKQPNGDEYFFFSPGVLLIRALTGIYTGQERFNFHHCKSDIWMTESARMMWDIIFEERVPTRLLNANDPTPFKCPFISQLPFQLCNHPEVLSDERYYMENLFEATLNWFESMTLRCLSNPNTSDRSCNIFAERNTVTEHIIGFGIFHRTVLNTSLRKERNKNKAKTSKSEIKKANRSRTREYQPKCPLNALKKNSYLFGDEILNVVLTHVPNSKEATSGQKRKCTVCPNEDELPDECA